MFQWKCGFSVRFWPPTLPITSIERVEIELWVFCHVFLPGYPGSLNLFHALRSSRNHLTMFAPGCMWRRKYDPRRCQRTVQGCYPSKRPNEFCKHPSTPPCMRSPGQHLRMQRRGWGEKGSYGLMEGKEFWGGGDLGPGGYLPSSKACKVSPQIGLSSSLRDWTCCLAMLEWGSLFIALPS